MDSQGQDYSYTQPPQYGYPPQPQQYPQHHPPALQPYAPHPSFPQYPPFNPPQPQQFYPPPFAGPHNLSYTPSATSAAPPSPFDPELQKRIDKLVEYTAKNGPEFEIMIREKQSNNPDYSFLFGGDGHNYYRYKLLNINFTHPPPPAPSAYHQMIPPPYHQPSYQLRGFVGLRGPLPADVAAELDAALNGLTGTKESIKAAKSWFMQRAPFAPALAEGLKDRVFSLDDSERQLHVVFLANDILFESLQNRINPRELDNEARALLPVLGSMLSRVYHNPQNRDENQSRLLKIIQFWSSREVFDQETITSIEREMITGTVPTPFPVPPQNWQHDNTQITPPYSLPTQIPFSGPVPVPVPTQPVIPLPVPTTDPNPPPYPLFPPGLIPGMVRKMQIGSGVPYSPLSPLDIPTLIPPSPIPESQILERVSKFFKEIGEMNPSRRPTGRPTGKDVPDDEYDGYGRESPVRKGGTCIPPPVSLQVVDPETGMHADGSVPESTGTGRLGLGAVNPDDSSQYDDVYSSYRKHRSTSYHTFMSSRAENR